MADGPLHLRTSVSYSFVGSFEAGRSEQRTGAWEINWKQDSEVQWSITRWIAHEERRSSLREPESRLVCLWHDEPSQAFEPLRAADRIAPGDVRPKIALTIASIETQDETQAQESFDALQFIHADDVVIAHLSAALSRKAGFRVDAVMSMKVAYVERLALLSSGDAMQAQKAFTAGLAQPGVRPDKRADLLLGMALADALRGTQHKL